MHWTLWWFLISRVVLSEAVDWCICFTQKIQHGDDWERSRPQGPKNVYTFLMTLSWAKMNGTEMLLILKKTIFDLIIQRYFPIWQSKEMYHSPRNVPRNVPRTRNLFQPLGLGHSYQRGGGWVIESNNIEQCSYIQEHHKLVRRPYSCSLMN